MSSIQPAQRTLRFVLPYGTSYVDLAAALSAVNRRFYRQGMQYAVSGFEFEFGSVDTSAVTSVTVGAYTAGSTWVVHNAWKKAQAHWLAQQREARTLIGLSAKPAYEDFKVYLDDAQRTGTTNAVLAGDGAAVGAGEWDYSRFVWEADDNSIDEPYVHLIGGNVSTTDWGLILNYQQSRATVQAEDPALPAEYSTNMYALMAADENLVADEVAQNMESDNDNPPYDQDDYPGSDTNSDAAWLQQFTSASAGAPHGQSEGFVAQCGLIKFELAAAAPNGSDVGSGAVGLLVHLAPGNYKGVLAEPMGQ
jgi:hypothetical protein